MASWSREAGDTVLVKPSTAPLRACPRRSTWPITGRRGRSWARAVTRVKERPGFQRAAKEGRQQVRGEEWSEGDERDGR